MYTCSIATVGTSAIMMRRNALAKETSTPIISNTNSWGEGVSKICIANLDLRNTNIHSIRKMVKFELHLVSSLITYLTRWRNAEPLAGGVSDGAWCI
jgi:hypothetical protein